MYITETEKELLPDAAETMNALSEAEKTAVSLLLKAYIGFLSEEIGRAHV